MAVIEDEETNCIEIDDCPVLVYEKDKGPTLYIPHELSDSVESTILRALAFKLSDPEWLSNLIMEVYFNGNENVH